MLSARDVAKYFLSQVDEEGGDSISNLKLQKLLYYAQGFHLASRETALFPERIEAWAHGPVVPPIYHVLKHFGAAPVAIEGDLDPSLFDKETRELLDEVYGVYGQF